MSRRALRALRSTGDGRVLGVADFISLASPGRAKLAHSIAPPLQLKPASLGFALGAACGGHCGRIGAPPTCTLCHGWSEPGAAVKPYRPKLPCRDGSPDPPASSPPQRLEPERSGAPVWSSIPAHLDFGSTAVAAWMRGQSLSLLRLTVAGRPLELGPRKFRGSGGGPAGAIRRPRDTPGGVLPPLPPQAKEVAPQGETLQGAARRVVAPYGRHGSRRTGGHTGPPLRRSTATSETWREGQAPPLRGERGNIPRQRTGGETHSSIRIRYRPV